jgi:hypothetical protein
MDLQRRDEFKQKLYELTPSDGDAIGNPTLREALQTAIPEEKFSLDDYWDLRNSLITDGKLEKGRGRGGSVRRVLTVAEPLAVSVDSTTPAAEIIKVAATEASFYEPFKKCIQEGYVPDNDLKPWVCEITAFPRQAEHRRYLDAPGRHAHCNSDFRVRSHETVRCHNF